MKNKNLSLSPDPFFIVLLLLLWCTYLNAVAIKDTFVSPANTISGELRLDSNSEINGTDSNGYVYTTNLSVNDGQCYDTDGNAVTCQAKGENVKALYFKVYNGDGSDGDKEISSDLTIDSSNIDSYDNVGKFTVDDGVALTLDSVTIHANGDFIFNDNAKDLTIKGDVVIYADKFELGDNVGINIAADASLRIITSGDVTIGDSSFVDTNGHPEHFALFTKATISFDDYIGSKSFEGFFYSDSDFTVGTDVNITGAIVGGDVTEVKDRADINFDSSVIENTDISELAEDYCSKLFGGPASTIDGGELDIETNVKLKNTPSDGSLYTDNINTNDGKCYDTDGNEVTCKANNITAFTQIFTVYNGDGSDGDKEISSDLTIDSSNIDSYDNVGKFTVDDGVALTLDSVTIHANGDFIFNDNAKDLTIKGDVVIYADKFELGDNVGINIAADASLRIITSGDVTIGDSSFVDTNGHPEHFALFTKATISFDDYIGSKSFEGFFYSDSDFTVGTDVNITGAIVGQKVQIKDGSVIEFDNVASSSVANTGVCVNTPLEEKNYKFDAWDTFRDINDRNISTKIVNQEFNLTIASLNESGDDFQEFNGTVCVDIDNNISKLDFRDDNTSAASFKVSRAKKDIRVDITWKKDVDESCPFDSDYNETNSTDNFAIRPDKFIIYIDNSSPKAGVNFHIDINATGFGGENVKDYNETNGTTFVFDINDSNTTCVSGVLNGMPDPFKFGDGNISFDANYSDVGDVNFTIHEISGSEFAAVDKDDKNISGHWDTDENLTITPYSKKIIVYPYQFAVIDYKFIRQPDQFWRYMSDVNESNISISFRVEAQNKMGEVTKKFDKNCYSSSVGVKIKLTATSSDGNVSYYQSINNTPLYNHDKNLSDFNFSGTINDQNFTEGNSSKVIYALNVFREHNNPKNPLDINVTEINTTSTIAENIGLTPENNGSTFYYGKVKTRDITTNQALNVDNYIYIDVYSSVNNSYVNGFIQDSLQWYRMQLDNITIIKELIPQKEFRYNSDINKTGIALDKNSSLAVQIGRGDTNISNSWGKSDSAYIHLKIPSYLWYSSYKDYNDSNQSDCSEHPCFQYTYITDTQGKSITSGNYNGTTIMTKEFNASKIKKGVKVFR